MDNTLVGHQFCLFFSDMRQGLCPLKSIITKKINYLKKDIKAKCNKTMYKNTVPPIEEHQKKNLIHFIWHIKVKYNKVAM